MPAHVIERIRNAARVNHVVGVAVRYGFQQVVQQAQEARVGLFHRLRPSEHKPDPALSRMATGERLRRLLEELGPTFVKLGQFLSTRPDLVPGWAVEELVKLQDRVAPMPFELVKHQVESELGSSLEQLFTQFDTEPLGTASLGQVHRAVLPDGEVVAVKVQRPGIERAVQRDLSVLRDLAEMLEGRLGMTRHIKLTRVVDELADRMRDELVYTIEARNAERMSELLEEDDHIRIPKVYWNLTTPRVLTTTLFAAAKLTDEGQPPADLRAVLAQRLAAFTLRTVLVEGFFHADPHPGNLMVFADGDLGLIDWGQVGMLTRRMRESLDEIFIGIATKDVERLAAEIGRLGLADEHADLDGFRYDLSRALDRYFHVSRDDFPLGSILRKILELSYDHGVQLPTELPLLVKVLVALEGTCLGLDPQFDLRRQFEPLAKALAGQQLNPEQLLRTLVSNARQTSRFVNALPRQLTTILDRIEAGNLQVKVTTDVQDPVRHLGQMLNRLSLSAIVVGLMVAGALAMPHSHALGFSAFLAGLCAGLLVLLAILRSERL